MRGQVEHGLPPLVSNLCLEEIALVIAFHGYSEILLEEKFTWLHLSISFFEFYSLD